MLHGGGIPAPLTWRHRAHGSLPAHSSGTGALAKAPSYFFPSRCYLWGQTSGETRAPGGPPDVSQEGGEGERGAPQGRHRLSHPLLGPTDASREHPPGPGSGHLLEVPQGLRLGEGTLLWVPQGTRLHRGTGMGLSGWGVQSAPRFGVFVAVTPQPFHWGVPVGHGVPSCQGADCGDVTAAGVPAERSAAPCYTEVLGGEFHPFAVRHNSFGEAEI